MFRDTETWLYQNYRNENGLPQFFKEGAYTFNMKADAEEDYVFAVNQASKDHADLEYHTWAKNMQLNEYRVNYLKEYA